MPITDGFDLIAPEAYTPNGPPHDTWTRLRAESPVHRCDHEAFNPYWAISRHADICTVSKQPDLFLSQPGIILERAGLPIDRDAGIGAMRTVIEMDPPGHREYRKVASPWFTPRAMNRIDGMVQETARWIVDRLAGDTGEGEADFAFDVAAAYPLRVLSSILGIPIEQEQKMLELTNQIFAPEDEELGFGTDFKEGEVEDAVVKLGMELFGLFNPIIEDRRANPRDDLASVLANGRVDGQAMGPLETLGYYLITFTAGHDTTKNSLAGGMRALIDHPEELEKLKRDRSLIPSAVEEIIRWTSPVNYMRRTASCDTVLSGQKIQSGDALVLFYASGNRDETVFDDPFCFKVDRNPNRHIGFGYGEHFCLGSHLARRTQRALLEELIPRLEHMELAGEPEWIRSSFVVGYKHLPIRYRIAKGG